MSVAWDKKCNTSPVTYRRRSQKQLEVLTVTGQILEKSSITPKVAGLLCTEAVIMQVKLKEILPVLILVD